MNQHEDIRARKVLIAQKPDKYALYPMLGKGIVMVHVRSKTNSIPISQLMPVPIRMENFKLDN